MHTATLHRLLATALLAATALPAQVRPGVYGYQVVGVNGTAGEFCHLFDCTPRPLGITAGETLTLRVNAPFQALFAIGASFTATSCISLPFAANSLIIDQPIVTLAVGLVSTPSPILSCWGGTVQVPLPIPAWVPLGVSIATQAVADVPGLNGNQLAFSVAVVATTQ